MSDPQEDWLLWQLADSALPTGGFVASSGLESAVHSGYVSDVASLSLFTSSSITNYAHSSLPFMTDSWKLGAAFIRYEVDLDGERMLTDLLKLDALCDACTTNIVSKRASKAQGVAMLTLFSKSFPFKLSKGKEMKGQKINLTIEKFKSEIRHGFSYGHLSVCFGIVTSFLELSLAEVFCLPPYA
ncbi:hypothetical protein G9A89_004558 [Geosiphon pyriformis]|nr:hypothetical protein G9A89_004558 [Geosiphon pyriformis]